MKIYTKTGDKGETSLFGGERVGKDALRIDTYGTVDELNSLLGVVRSLKPGDEVGTILERVQNDLFALGADLATPQSSSNAKVPRMETRHAEELEPIIDSLESKLRPLRAFILPGGSPVGAHLHLARTVCRRGERLVVKLSKSENIGTAPVVYLNRLSDLLFVLARYANHLEGEQETEWHPR
ncbi:MAG: cob(I)yrinic acid a,c-diamide adenosyltransferase [Ignavibacteriales bacterium]|nr:cob(I)yrinic acid a,c-diamide adenosyltransferase [Ignavibacteriales bacterium]